MSRWPSPSSVFLAVMLPTYYWIRLKKGMCWKQWTHAGHFFPKQADDQTRQVVFIGAGSGITPLFSILKSILMVEAESEVFLLYGSRNEDSIIFKSKIAALEAKYGERFKVVHTLSQP
jgi:ring-1,2-phenylacetyl-CoA epoxidase subunit PaaE